MKKLQILLFIVAAINVDGKEKLDGSNQDLIDSLYNRIGMLEQRLMKENYTMVPKADIERVLDNKVKGEVQTTMTWWIAGLAGMITFVSVLLGAYNRTQIRDQAAEIQRSFADSATQIIQQKINSSISFLWNSVATSFIDRAKELNYQSPDVITDIEQFLDKTDVPIHEQKKVLLIDSLMRCYYHTPGLPEKYKKMISLLSRFEKEHDLLPETYANAAIALCNNYEYFGVKNDRDTCIDACDKSINRLQDYGIPYALKLEVFCIEHMKAFSDKEKEAALDNIRRTFKAIDNNQSKYICKEIHERMQVDREIKYLAKYIEELEKLFPEDMNRIRNRALTEK